MERHLKFTNACFLQYMLQYCFTKCDECLDQVVIPGKVVHLCQVSSETHGFCNSQLVGSWDRSFSAGRNVGSKLAQVSIKTSALQQFV